MTKPTYEELERQLAEANARANKYDDLFRTERDKLVAALGDNAKLHQQIEDSRKQEPVAWTREEALDGSGAIWAVFYTAKCFDDLEPLYASPIVPPDVEEAVKEEREAIAELAIKWGNAREDDYGGHALRKFASAIRERGEK